MRVKVGKALVSTCILAALSGTAGANTSTPFPAGSLIIPTSGAFQDDCGAVSAYGLIYDVLRANTWLAANGYTPITIYYSYLDTKSSPNRCVPTSLNTGVAPSGPPAVIAPATAAMWNDGCDISGVSAQLIVNNNHLTAPTNITTFDTTSKTNVSPGYQTKVVASPATVSYLGGPFIIFVNDAPTFRGLLDGTLVSNIDHVTHAKDALGNVIDFSPFRTRNASQKAAPADSPITTENAQCSWGIDHYVNVHIATATFTANVGKSFSAVPPRLALLASDKNGHTGTINDGILEGYLQNAGLSYAGAGGCASINAATSCASVSTGQIFDKFDFDDLATKLLPANYTMLWTPHWESNGGGGEAAAFSQIKTFLNGQTGLAAECAAISTYEGGKPGVNALPSTISQSMQLQTCVDDGTHTGTCSATTTNYGVLGNPVAPYGSPGLNTHQFFNNCSDPNLATATGCVYFPYPGDSFVQVGDFKWDAEGGWVTGYQPWSGATATYQTSVVPLVSLSTLTAGNKATLQAVPTPYNGSTRSATDRAAHAFSAAELASRSLKDNAPGKANVLYLGGHDQNFAIYGVSGTKMMLETLLQLGTSTLPPVTSTTEVSRNSPIVGTIAGTTNPVVFQGTYENVTPVVAPTTFSVSADSTNFRFPAIKGHFRARDTGTITTTASTFGSSGVVFDAATGIPPATYAGCGTRYTNSCRTVFTTIVAGPNPTLHYLESAELANIGPLMGPAVGPNPILSVVDQGTLISRVLAGDDSAIHGLFQPKLGGVDRSTVAVIPTSTLVNGTRETMAYFGADDGMLHAVCASVAGNCTAVGQELWAYLPRTNLPIERYNTGRVDGSPRVMDMFGDFYGAGTKSWRTILTFQTGDGDTSSQTRVPAVYALDISNPEAPQVIWEFSLANYSSLHTYELGVGETMAAGQVQSGTLNKYYVFAETNNAGSGGTGVVVTAIDAEKGTQAWQTGYVYPTPPTLPRADGAHPVVPSTGIPGGAIAIDKKGAGYITDLVYADLYGNLWEVDPATGVSRYGAGKPEFSFSTDFRPIGAQPAIYSKGGTQYAVIVDGGYADPFDTTWTNATTQHSVLGVSLNAPVLDATFNETKGSPDIGFSFNLTLGEAGYAQAVIVGTQLVLTSDSTDVNNTTTYGTGAASGHVYRMDLATNITTAPVVVQGGASSVGVSNNGGGTSTVFTGASSDQQTVTTTLNNTGGTGVDPTQTAKVSRNLWLRSQ